MPQQRLGLLLQAPARIGAAESHEELLKSLLHVMRALFPDLLRVELYLTDGTGSIGLASRLGTPRLGVVMDARGSLGARLLPGLGSDALTSNRHGLLRGPAMCVPLMNGRDPYGLIVVDSARGRHFTNVDLQVLEGVAAVCSLAFQRISSRHADRVRASFELDRRSATQVQRRLMGPPLPHGAGVKVDAQYRPALDVGGDFYEVSYLGDGRVGAAIGDVSGKGVSAALIMSRVSSDLRRAVRSGRAPSRVLQDVNDSLADIEADTFVTAACICLDQTARTLTISSAGHIPVVVRRASGEVFDFGTASGTPLGVMPCEYTEERLDIRPKDIVLLMTDGLVDALDCPSDRSGSRRLHRLVATAPHDPAAINAIVLKAATQASSAQSRDDVTLVALQFDPG